jgi:hypothetical protein
LKFGHWREPQTVPQLFHLRAKSRFCSIGGLNSPRHFIFGLKQSLSAVALRRRGLGTCRLRFTLNSSDRKTKMKQNQKKQTRLSTLAIIFLWLGSCYTATAQDVAQSDQITQGEQIIQADSSTTGKFEAVTVGASATSAVALWFPLGLVNKAVTVQPLDGGILQTADPAIDQNGKLSFSFQVSDRPGRHRVVVVDPNADVDSPPIIAVVQFEVPSL